LVSYHDDNEAEGKEAFFFVEADQRIVLRYCSPLHCLTIVLLITTHLILNIISSVTPLCVRYAEISNRSISFCFGLSLINALPSMHMYQMSI
jgi:hypothetical protein